MNKIGFTAIPRPVHEKNDCVVRAYANATGTEYELAYVRAQQLGRRFGRGCAWGIVLAMYAPFGAPKQTRSTIGTFVREHPTGTFIARIRGHAFAIRDGVVLDTSAPRPRAIITHFWQVAQGVELPENLPVPKENEEEFLPAMVVKPRAPQPAFNINALMQRLSTLRIAEPGH